MPKQGGEASLFSRELSTVGPETGPRLDFNLQRDDESEPLLHSWKMVSQTRPVP